MEGKSLKIIIILLTVWVLAATAFGQLSLSYDLDSTWVVFNIDSIERTQFEGMYPYQSYIPVGRPGLTTFYDSALLFEDVDGDGTKEILGSSGHDADGPVHEITDEIAKNYSISVYEPQGLDYKLEHKYKNFDERIVGLADFEGDGDKDLFTLWMFYGYEIDPISNDSINVNRGGYHVYDVVSDSLIASWERFSSKNLPGGHVEVHSGPFIHYVNDIDSDGHAEMFFSFAQPNSIDSLGGYYCRSTLDGFYIFNKNTNTFDLKYDFSNLLSNGAADDWLKSFALGDLTNDGEPEFIIQGQARANTGLVHTHIWVFRPENGNLIPITHLDAYGQQFPNPKIMVTNDMDNNGHNELIMTNNMGGTAVYWFELINNELQLKRKAMILIPECISDTSLSVYNGFNGRIVDANADGFDEIAFSGNFRALVLGWNRITNEFMPFFNFHS